MTNTPIKLLGLTAILCCCTYAAAQMSPDSAGAGMASNESPTAPSPAPSMGQESPFLGGVPPGPPQPGVMALSIADAIRHGLQYNLGLLLTRQGTEAARGARYKALSHLLPDIS